MRKFQKSLTIGQKEYSYQKIVKTLYETPENPTFEVFTISGNAIIADFSREPPKIFQL